MTRSPVAAGIVLAIASVTPGLVGAQPSYRDPCSKAFYDGDRLWGRSGLCFYPEDCLHRAISRLELASADGCPERTRRDATDDIAQIKAELRDRVGVAAAKVEALVSSGEMLSLSTPGCREAQQLAIHATAIDPLNERAYSNRRIVEAVCFRLELGELAVNFGSAHEHWATRHARDLAAGFSPLDLPLSVQADLLAHRASDGK